MEHFKTFNAFVGSTNESDVAKNTEVNENVDPLNEGDIYVSNENFKDETSLVADIIKNMPGAFNKMLKDAKIDYSIDSVVFNSNRFELKGKPLTGDALGIMKWGIKEVWINSFGGGQIQVQKGEEFQYTPVIWFSLHYSYTHGSESISSQGSNGCALFLPGEQRNDVWYDIDNKEFLPYRAAEKKLAELHKNAK
jgi:hypothetical protein